MRPVHTHSEIGRESVENSAAAFAVLLVGTGCGVCGRRSSPKSPARARPPPSRPRAHDGCAARSRPAGRRPGTIGSSHSGRFIGNGSSSGRRTGAPVRESLHRGSQADMVVEVGGSSAHPCRRPAGHGDGAAGKVRRAHQCAAQQCHLGLPSTRTKPPGPRIPAIENVHLAAVVQRQIRLVHSGKPCGEQVHVRAEVSHRPAESAYARCIGSSAVAGYAEEGLRRDAALPWADGRTFVVPWYYSDVCHTLRCSCASCRGGPKVPRVVGPRNVYHMISRGSGGFLRLERRDFRPLRVTETGGDVQVRPVPAWAGLRQILARQEKDKP